MSLCIYLVDENNHRVRDPEYNPNTDYECMGTKPTDIEINIPNIYSTQFNFKNFHGNKCDKAANKLKRQIADFTRKIKPGEENPDFWDPCAVNILKVFNKLLDYSQQYPRCTWRVI